VFICACAVLQGQRGVQYRLELFMSRDKGWGVQSWDGIKGGSLVCIMHGNITRWVCLARGASTAGGGHCPSCAVHAVTPRCCMSGVHINVHTLACRGRMTLLAASFSC
jgi:hypothetical protein